MDHRQRRQRRLPPRRRRPRPRARAAALRPVHDLRALSDGVRPGPRGDPHRDRAHRARPVHRAGLPGAVRGRRNRGRAAARARLVRGPGRPARRRAHDRQASGAAPGRPVLRRRRRPARAARGPGSSAIADRLWLKLDPSTLGWALGQPSGKGEMRAWFGLADGRDADPLSLLLAVDALPPTAFEMGLSGWVPTIELTVHVRAKPAPGPLRVAITTRNLAGGFLEEDAEVWDSADRLVAQSRQLARARLR
nr:acyl-CoA thioesterase domain-containing protein [Streptomyces alboflavus]